MPVTPLLPDTWYDTLNIHHLTIDDFRALVKVWANTSAKGLEELKAQSPVPASKP